MMETAFQHGVNFYDTAEIYGNGQAEEPLGGAINKGIDAGVWSREDLVISTKIFCGSKGFTGVGPNDQGNSRKHLVEGLKASLKRLNLEYVDVVFSHRLEPEWLASDVREACEIADRLALIRPIVEQSQYNIFERNKVEFELEDLYKKYKLGLTTWSPLDNGTLTGKYSGGVPNDSRFNMDEFKAFGVPDYFPARVKIADQLKPIAESLAARWLSWHSLGPSRTKMCQLCWWVQVVRPN
ncbi:hypothetical protein V7S43_017626 [Phytophthora oleae]|uniref:NADP-dependent oxidoreductase domain-containing protein n=1 Tax=Phytophthora oleae TaxID=2107226 RepID=A0ABD3EUX4_9STRA